MKNNFKKFKKTPLVISIIFMLLAFVGFMSIYMAIQNNNESFNEKAIKWQTETEKRNEIKSLDRTLKNLDPEIKILNSHFIQSTDVVPFLDTIEKLAPKVNAEAKVLSVDIASDNSSLMVGLSAGGSFSSIYKYIMLLENSPYQIEFVSMDIKNSSANDSTQENSLQWSAVLKIKLLSFLK